METLKHNCGVALIRLLNSPSPACNEKGWRIDCVTPCGAENETRTRDPDLGKVVLYQLSYFRKFLRNLRYFWLRLGRKKSFFTRLAQKFRFKELSR